MRARSRGGPLKGLGLLLIAWISVRAVTFSAVPSVEQTAPISTEGRSVPTTERAAPTSRALVQGLGPSTAQIGRSARTGRQAAPAIVATLSLTPRRLVTAKRSIGTASGRVTQTRLPGFARNADADRPFAPLAPAGVIPTKVAQGGESRWSADGWMLLRRGGGGDAGAGLRAPSYGASQAGAVLRYRLAPQSAHRPFAYARATTTLRGVNEQQAALGLGLRPIPRLPVSAAAEVRVLEGPGGRKLQPAGFVVTELAPIALPAKLQAELYAQAGYVGGAFATPFADGQLRVDHSLASFGRAAARVGGGAWGGAQKGAARLDVGPTANVWFPLSQSSGARLALDWRLRVAGDAQPDSGPALTLSAGF